MIKAALLLAIIAGPLTSKAAGDAEVRVIGQMRRMFMAHDIGPNVDLQDVTKQQQHVYGLGPFAGLKGEVTIVDGEVFRSQVKGEHAAVSLDRDAKAVFLVYADVPAWRSVTIPTNVVSETDLATFLERSLPSNTRSAFLVRGTVVRSRYHIQNFQGKAEDLTHEAHDKSKVFFDLTDRRVQLVGFFSNREEDGGSFVHPGQTTHIHILSEDHNSMGHLESFSLAPGAKLFLPQAD